MTDAHDYMKDFASRYERIEETPERVAHTKAYAHVDDEEWAGWPDHMRQFYMLLCHVRVRRNAAR